MSDRGAGRKKRTMKRKQGVENSKNGTKSTVKVPPTKKQRWSSKVNPGTSDSSPGKQSTSEMATSNNSGDTDAPHSAMDNMVSNSEETELLNNLLLQQRGGLLQEPANVYNISAGAYRPGTVDSDTLELMLAQANQTFVPTRTFKDIKRSLEKNHHATICGASGEGKTTMALMIGQMYRKQGYELVFVNRADVFDLGSCISSGQKICLIFDDIFGSVGQSTDFTHMKRLCNSLKMHIDHNLLTGQRNKTNEGQNDKVIGQIGGINKDKTKHSPKQNNEKSLRVIFTAKTYNFKEGMSKMQYQRLSMFNMKTVVDLTLNPEPSYSHQEKKAMFQKHREMHPRIKLGDLVVDDVVDQESTLFGFPLTCRLFFEFPTFTEKAADFFKRPLYYLRIELNDILSRKNDQAAALVLVLLCEENIKIPELESPNSNKKVEDMFMYIKDFANSASRSGIADAARSFRGTFLSRGDNLSFAHSSIYEACACALYQFNPTFVLKYCSLDFLYERLKPGDVDESGVSDRLHYLFVSEGYYHLVATRLITSMKQGVFSKTVAHPMNQNEHFVEKFLEKLMTSASENKDWIQLKEKGKGFLYWAVRSKSTQLVQSIETVLLTKFTQDDISEALFASVECDNLATLKHLVERLDTNPDQSYMNKLLIVSAEKSSKEMVSHLLHMGAHISGTDTEKRNVLHLLCIHDRSTVLETIITQFDDNKDDLQAARNALDEDGRTPLMLSALHGTWDSFKQMQEEGLTDLSDSKGDYLIHLACYGGNKHIVEEVLTSENINMRADYEETPIMIAAFNAKSDVFDLLLSNHADTTLVDDDGDTLLHLACHGGSRHIVERILTPDNINSRGQSEWTPIMRAALNAKSDVFDLLLSNHADTTLVDDDGDTLLHLACMVGSRHIVERILTPDNINSRGKSGWTPIMRAAFKAKSDVFDLLLSNHADTTLVYNGDTLLHLACMGGSKHIVERILIPDNINSRGQSEWTPIMMAAFNAKSDLFDLLLSNHADTTLVNDDGDTLLHLACMGGSKHIVERILTPDNINSRCQSESTPIMMAAFNAKSDVFDLLLSNHADTTLVDDDGDTLLHHACHGGSKHIVERILTPDNINSRGQSEWTPIMMAAFNAKSDVFDLLLSNHADTTLVDDDGDTLLHLACHGGSKHIVERILTPDNINSRGQSEWTPIMRAALNAKSDVFDLLLSNHADTTLVDDDGDTLLHLACHGGSRHIVERILTPDNINSRGKSGWTPIMRAAFKAKSDVFDLLLSNHADTTLVYNGDTLLHLACMGGSKHIVERILIPDNINSRGQSEWTPIMMAAFNAKSDLFDLLLSNHADTTLVNDDGDTLLHLACHGGSKHIVERILTPDNINSRCQSESTPIMMAAFNAKSDVFDLLLSNHADTTLVDDDGDTLLHHACHGGSKHIVERILTPDNINSRGQSEWTPIMMAAFNAKSDVFDLLLSNHADTTLVDDDGDTLLHLACHGGSKHIVERILTPDNINSRGQSEWTPIMRAALNAKSDVFDLLLSNHADTTLVDDDGDTLLHLACMVGSRHIVERILTPDNINSRGKSGWTPIMRAAFKAKSDVFDLLLSNHADTTLVYNGDTLLHLACMGGSKHIVERILTPDNINSRGQSEWTPIMIAAFDAKSDVFDFLLSNHADTTLVNDDGDTLLHLACHGGSKHIVERILTPDNINSRGQSEWTPIMMAAFNAKSDVFDLLLSNHADTTLVDDDGDTLLHHACHGGSKHIVERILTPDNINSRGQSEWTPIMMAAFNAKSDVFDLLLSNHADTTLVDDDGDTLLHLACHGGSKHIVERILTPDNINSRGQSEWTTIMIAAFDAKSDVFDFLLSNHADTTLVDDDGDTLLHHACHGGSKHIVERILTPDNINSRGQSEWTPIMMAAFNAKSDVFDLLLSNHADTTLVDDDGDTLLHLACHGGSKHIVERILTPDNINSRGQSEWTTIMIAAFDAKSDVFDFLLSNHADTTLVDDDGDTLLHLACHGGSKHIVERILTPDNINSRGQSEWTPIMMAAFNAKSDVFDFLLSNHADTTLVNDDGDTLLHLACHGGSKHIVERILTPDNINSQTKNRWTPIQAAAFWGHVNILELLCEKGADLTCLTPDGRDVVAVAESEGKTNAVKYLKTQLSNQ